MTQSSGQFHAFNNQKISSLVAALLSAWNSHDHEMIASFYAPDYEGIDVAWATPRFGPEGVRQTVARYLAAFPDLHFTEEATLIQGTRAALFWVARGTHQGKLLNIPATGREINVRGVSLLTIIEDKITHSLHLWDVAGLLRNLNLLPELPEQDY